MTPLPPDAASAALDVAQEQARLVRNGVEVALTKRRRLRVVYTPDTSYGRYHAPLPGNEEFEFTYYVWSIATHTEDVRGGHVAPEKRGWRCVYGGEFEALALLQGIEAPDPLAAGKTLAERFS